MSEPAESRMRVAGIDAAWINNNQPADVVVLTCLKCGWELEMRAGYPPIPHRDPRLTCPHGEEEPARGGKP